MEGQVVGRHPEGSGGSPLLSPLLSKPPLLLPCAGLHAPAALVAALIAEQSSSATGLSPSPPSCSPSYLILIFMQQQPALAG